MTHHQVRIAGLLVLVTNLVVAFLIFNLDEAMAMTPGEDMGQMRLWLGGVALTTTLTLGVILISGFWSFLTERNNPFLQDEAAPSWADLILVLLLLASAAVVVWIVV
ncbi:MAG: hypothetical protein AAGD38_23960 [Acidobacteriota bacterium]